MTFVQDALAKVLELGGPVVLLLLAVSVLTTALVLYKIWQYRSARVGQHKALASAVAAWDRGEGEAALDKLSHSQSYLVPVMRLALSGTQDTMLAERADAEAEERFSQLERGLGALDMVAQLAPLLGLFGTVIGMIEAFQKLQSAGASVDPSLLAGGIWVALLTTAAGLAVAMPTSLVLSWLTARMQRERVFANRALRTIFAPTAQTRPIEPLQVAHGT
ncbi:outer membrane transport energization protein ExbB [Phaeobacter piscinae]|uniref:Outer membrane transport energization protein ExbB n=1 Tax=Phaeobacter piscinae TaxID=1580596 RepID=A0AAN1GU77_9RHOB|nr:MotA/TolQ/ExbB proton channel family protein [Phaeobacter piscinae]ATG45085.1 outer membrane transport energization protein ExbB [Phaeobacter piscinae]AUR37398.1 outer membrane transport energization protein ExbB [Phaeobacter piscinae]